MNIEYILEQHKIWLDTEAIEGKRAEFWSADLRGVKFWQADLRDACLRGANLRDADLRSADLRDADLRGADLRSADLPEKTFIIQGEAYFLMITNGDNVRAGCQCHSAEKWKSFTPAEIEKMYGKQVLEFYPRLLEIIDFYCDK